MREQIHGGDIYRNPNVIDFSVNSNPLGPPKAVVETILKHAVDIVHYPDMECENLRKAIGLYEQISPSCVLCGNGAAELFYAIAVALQPKKALLLAPTFSEYEKALRVVKTQIQYEVLTIEQGFEVQESILEKITPQTEIMFFCNPNNPTGLVTDPELLKKIIFRCEEHHVVLVLDECFLDFLEGAEKYDMKKFLSQCKYLLIVKAFTKIFCMPGLRLGYCMSENQELLSKIRSVMQAWNVSVLAQLGGISALEHPEEYLANTRYFIEKERESMKSEFRKMGYQVYDSKANYVFFEGSKGLYEKALKAGFLIRDCRNYVGLEEGAYRIAIRTHEENERMITWLKQL